MNSNDTNVVTLVKLDERNLRESNIDSNFNPVKCEKDNSFDEATTECFNEEDDDMKCQTKIITKTVECPDTGNQKTFKSIVKIQYASKPPAVQTNLNESRFTIGDGKKDSEIPFFITKMIRKTDPKNVDQNLTLKVDSLISYCPVATPISQTKPCTVGS